MEETAEKIIYSDLYVRNKRKNTNGIINFLSQTLIPPPDMEIDDWAEGRIVLSGRVTKNPGPIHLHPPQRRALRALKYYQRVSLCWGAQGGKTIVVQCFLGYIIDNDPGPAMIVYPSQNLCLRRSKKHLKPMIEDSPVLAAHTTGNPDDLQRFSYTLDRMDVILAWAGSASEMASEPIRYLIRDETAKFPGASATEADAMSLSERRTISYSFLRRILDVTTPTVPTGHGWTDLLEGTYHETYIPCPKCGTMQVLRFKNFDYPKRELDEPERVYYERIKKVSACICINDECKHRITNAEKIIAMDNSEERPNNPDATSYSSHLPSWYAPYVSFGEVVERYIKSVDDPEARRDVINSDFAEPYYENTGAATVERVLAYRTDYEPESLPIADPVVVFLVVDVQKGYLWFDVWAHRPGKCYKIEDGTISDFGQLEKLQQKVYTRPDGANFKIWHTFIDARYRTQEVYEYCAAHKAWYTTPVMGFAEIRDSTSLIRWSDKDSVPGKSHIKLSSAIKLMEVNSREFGEEVLRYLHSGFESESDPIEDFNPDTAKFVLHKRATMEYAKHLTRRYPVEETDSRGRTRRVWKEAHKRHDFFDTFGYNLAARYLYRDQIAKLDDIKIDRSGGSAVVATIE